jgi:hypothetical protein
MTKFSALYGIRKFITVSTTARYRALSCARYIYSIPPHPIFIRTILILSSFIRPDLPNGLFHSGFSMQTLDKFVSFPIHATSSAYSSLLDWITLIISDANYKLCSFLQPPLISSPCGPNDLSTLFSNPLSLCSSLKAV